MSDSKRYCMGCMNKLDEHTFTCPNCHHTLDAKNNSAHIQQGKFICDKYLVGKALAVLNDSVMYIGLDTVTEQAVVIYEFYPNRIATRAEDGYRVIPSEDKAALYENCLESFLGLWRGIKMFDDVRCLPHVKDIQTANGTAYAITEYKETVALKDYFAKTRKPLAAAKAIAAFLPVLNGLKLLHNAGIVHGNITPSSIQVGADGRLNLVGFSIPQCRSDIQELATRPVSGFSALEIYRGGAAREQSDIYSIAAVMYYSITGMVLPRATERVENSKLTMPSAVVQSVPRNVLDAFSRALAVQASDRFYKVDEFVTMLKSQPTPKAPVSEKKVAAPTPEKSKPATNAATGSEDETRGFTPVAPEYTPSAASKPRPEAPVTVNRATKKPQTVETDTQEDKEETIVERKEPSFALLASLTCVAVVIICFIVFGILYSTVLYKSVEISLFDNMLSSMSFLPMNQNRDDADQGTGGFSDEADEPSGGISYVTVPDFTKFTEDHIRGNETFQSNFNILYRYESSETVDKGGVISQSINKNESVESGTTITLTISTGQPEKEVPDVLGKPFNEAKKELEKAGFKVSKEVIENPDNKPADTVSNMSIEPGKMAQKGTEIVLYVFDEPVEETTEALTTETETTQPPTTTQPETTTTKPTTTEPETTTTKPSTTVPTTTEPVTTQSETVESVE